MKKVAVIGAGPMGLAVAYQLVLDGHIPVIFEADDRIGGMTASFDFGGVEIERYYHFHCTSDEAFFELLEELNLGTKLHWVNTRMGYWYRGAIQPWGNPIALLRFKGLGLPAKVRYGLHAFLSVKRDNWKPLERYDALSWVRKWVGNEAYKVLWEKLFFLKFYEHSTNLSAPWIWSRIRRIGRSRYNLFKEKLGYLNGGSKTLLGAMRERIESLGGEFRLSSAVQQIIVEKGQAAGVVVHDESLYFERVISTIPLPLAGRLLPDSMGINRDKLLSKENIGVVCVIAKLAKPLSENFWLNTNDDGMDIPGIIEYGNLNPEVGHIVYVPYYMPRSNLKYLESDETFKSRVSAYFQAINPGIRDEDILDMAVHRYDYAQPICHPCYPESLPPEEICKGLYLADTTYYYPEDRGISESIGYGRSMARRAVL